MSIAGINSDKHCMFLCSGDRYCLPALSIRNVAERPQIFPVPLTDSVLAGIAHVEREFLPVFRFAGLLPGKSTSANEDQLLVMADDISPWGLLVDSVVGLETIEVTLNAQRGDVSSWSSAAIGSASWGNDFVTVVDAAGLQRMIASRLDHSWGSTFANPGID